MSILDDVYEVWDAWEFSQTDMLYSLLRSIEDSLYPLLEQFMSPIANAIEWIMFDLTKVGADITEAIENGLELAGDAIGWAMEPVVNAITDGLDWVVEGVTSLTESITEWFGDSFASVKGFLGDFWDNLKGWTLEGIQDAWGWLTSASSGVYEWISDLLGDAWDAFWFTAVPWLGEMLIRVIESEEVEVVLNVLGGVIEAVFARVFTIDTEEVTDWIRQTIAFFKTVTEEAVQ